MGNSPLHILSVNQDRGIGPHRKKGAAVHLRAMRQAFREQGARVSEIDENDSAKLEASLHRLTSGGLIHMIYERYSLGQSTTARFAKEKGIPFVLEVNAPLADEQQLWRARAESEKDRREDSFVFSSAAFIAAVSSQVADYAEARGGRADRVFVCPNGIDTSLFRPGVSPRPPLAVELPENAFVLGFHGRERPWHGFDLLVDAALGLLEQKIPAHLLVIGEGNFTALEKLPGDVCTHLPWMEQDRLPALISMYDALPLTYSRDAPFYFSPLKLAEAMACGAVPVVPDLGDLPSMVRHEQDGLVYKAGDRAALISGLMRLAGDIDFKNRLSHNAAERARMHGWEHIVTRILDQLGLTRGVRA